MYLISVLNAAEKTGLTMRQVVMRLMVMATVMTKVAMIVHIIVP